MIVFSLYLAQKYSIMTPKEELTKNYNELVNSDELIDSMMGMKGIFDLMKHSEMDKSEKDKMKFMLDTTYDMNNFIQAKFHNGDEPFMKGLLETRIAGLKEHLKIR